MLIALRALPHAHSAFPFGEALHFADRRSDVNSEQVARELQELLRASGFADAEVSPVTAGIEDVFMELMNQPRERAA